MKTYWDHTEQERAKLTEEQVEQFLAYELMEQGVLQVEPPKFEEITPIDLPKRRVFVLHEANGYGSTASLEIGFSTVEEAERARDAIRFIHESPWDGVPHFRPARALSIIAADVPTEEAVAISKAAIAEQKRREKANAEATRRHEEATTKVSKATEGVWSDWRACIEAEAHHQQIRNTLAEYRRLTDGNEGMARTFLAKAFPPDEIEAAVGPQPPEVAEAAA